GRQARFVIQEAIQESIDRILRVFAAEMSRVLRERGMQSITNDPLQAVRVTPLDPAVRETLVTAVRSVGAEPPLLVSGAGHDAQNPSLAGVPTGMLFIRSTGGSHNPNEHADTADAALGTMALERAIRALAGDA
ncbi:MAG: M20/M25/M40 family metallo-hydrolase, partial [Chloroflexota bacterium]